MNSQVVPSYEDATVPVIQEYRELMASRIPAGDPADTYIEDARKAIERERKRLERQGQKTAPKPASGAPPAGGN